MTYERAVAADDVPLQVAVTQTASGTSWKWERPEFRGSPAVITQTQV